MSAVRLPEGTLYQGKYNIFDPDYVEFVPRLDFLQKLTGVVEKQSPLEDILYKQESEKYVTPGEVNLAMLANNYKQAKAMGARLPKFSKWLTNMFVGNMIVQEAVAKAGQHQSSKIVLSTDLVDILRSGDTPHFHTCYNIAANNVTHMDMPVRIAEKTPGVMLAYSDDENGKMQGRVWLQAVEMPDESNAVIIHGSLGNISIPNVVSALQEKGATVLLHYPYIFDDIKAVSSRSTIVKNIGGFNTSTNFDFYGHQITGYLVDKLS